MYTLDRHLGRLFEVRITSPITVEDLERFELTVRSLIAAVPGRVVFAVDLRGARLFPPEVAERFVAIMRGDNPRVERSAFLVSTSALFSLQIERMIREAGIEKRRAFHDTAPLAAWLAEVLTIEERIQLDRFLAVSAPSE